MKNRIAKIVTSLVAVVLCFATLIGSTYAWFTDSATSSNNKIVAGTLKVDLELLDKQSGWTSIKNDNAPLFDYEKWEPGYTDVKILKVENEGSLALKWKARFVSNVALSALAEVIDVYVLPSATEIGYPTRNLDGYELKGTVADFVNTIEQTTYGTLGSNEVAYLGIALKMRETAGNEYQGLNFGGAFDIQILATQVSLENDSFDNSYDQNATYPNASTPVVIPDNAVEGATFKAGAVETNVSADFLNDLSGEVTKIQLVATNPEVKADGSLNYDSIEFVDQNGNKVGISGREYFEVRINVQGYFTAGQTLKIYHDDVMITEAIVDADGYAVYQTNHFCKVTLTEKVYVTVEYADGYSKNFNSLAKAMRYGYSGGEGTIIVKEDITESMDYLEGNIVCGKECGVTITNTIVDEWIYCDDTNFTIGEGITYTATGYGSGIFLYGDDCVINGTVIVDAYYQRYADTKLTINAPGSLTVKTETFILRYTDNDGNAGIYVNGDNDDSTVELKLAVAYFYQGMISIKDGTFVVGTYWQTNTTDGTGSANLVLDNSKMTVTVNEHDFKAFGNATVTLINGSLLNCAGGVVTTNEISVDQTSSVVKAR